MKKIIALFLIILTAVSLLSCGEGKPADTAEPIKTPEKQQTFDVTTKEIINIRITLADGRTMEAELYPQIAPITVQNFVDLCTSGFYDGLIFHRIIENFMIQGGDPNGNGTGGSGKTIKGEFSANGVKNDLKHTKGVLSMARRGKDSSGNMNYDSATSQFFIVSADSYPSLDGQYAAFGKLTSGFKLLAELSRVPTDENDKPLKDVVINSIRVIEGE
ncbi:MAG: peptidylprolyl isomerase [Clostridia bacterium]|nr:peptidylprolyl isomerase [Clostridia bacterium]